MSVRENARVYRHDPPRGVEPGPPRKKDTGTTSTPLWRFGDCTVSFTSLCPSNVPDLEERPSSDVNKVSFGTCSGNPILLGFLVREGVGYQPFEKFLRSG